MEKPIIIPIQKVMGVNIRPSQVTHMIDQTLELWKLEQSDVLKESPSRIVLLVTEDES
jgi:hypothetical protein